MVLCDDEVLCPEKALPRQIVHAQWTFDYVLITGTVTPLLER